MSLLAIIWVFMFLPETKGRTLEEMDELFGEAGFAQADLALKQRIEKDIGLTALIYGGEDGGEESDERKVSDSTRKEGEGDVFVEKKTI